jgi:NADH:ubiquinone oxidoreductase subunit 5 (subunit L)/multisubunit Na+/H+ antiporter MnhA subunit
MRKMGGLKSNTITFVTFLISSLAISGILLSGFSRKMKSYW